MKALVSLSGGMDSATVMARLIHEGHQVEAVAFAYGSKHNPYENFAAQKLAEYYKVPFSWYDLSPVMGNFKSSLMQSGGAIPEGHYNDATMSQTVVPGRNIIFLSLLAGIAWSRGAPIVGIGIHQGDHAIYPDCRPEFFAAMQKAITLGTDGKVELVAPFANTDKGGILSWGLQHEVPYTYTRTCYKHQDRACGKCGACVERLEAFAKNGVKDPVAYEGDETREFPI